jgi:hypothetical protein
MVFKKDFRQNNLVSLLENEYQVLNYYTHRLLIKKSLSKIIANVIDVDVIPF